MKKIVSILAAFILCVSMCVPAFAATGRMSVKETSNGVELTVSGVSLSDVGDSSNVAIEVSVNSGRKINSFSIGNYTDADGNSQPMRYDISNVPRTGTIAMNTQSAKVFINNSDAVSANVLPTITVVANGKATTTFNVKITDGSTVLFEGAQTKEIKVPQKETTTRPPATTSPNPGRNSGSSNSSSAPSGNSGSAGPSAQGSSQNSPNGTTTTTSPATSQAAPNSPAGETTTQSGPASPAEELIPNADETNQPGETPVDEVELSSQVEEEEQEEKENKKDNKNVVIYCVTGALVLIAIAGACAYVITKKGNKKDAPAKDEEPKEDDTTEEEEDEEEKE